MRKQALLTKETEGRISDTLSEVVELTACGLSPHDAMIKAAKEADLSVDQVRLLGRAYNTGVVLNQINSGQTIFEKAAAPELVDPEAVIRNIFGAAAKTKKKAAAVEYLLPPSVLFRKQLCPVERKKSASNVEAQENKSAADVRERKRLAEQSVSAVKYASIYNSADAVDRLRMYFNTPDSIDPQEVLENSAVCLGEHAEKLIKQATAGVTNNRFVRFAVVDWERPPYSYVRSGVDAIIKKQLAENVESKLVGSKKAANLSELRKPVYGSVIDHIVNSSCLNAKFAEDGMVRLAQSYALTSNEADEKLEASDSFRDFVTDVTGRQALIEARTKAHLAELAANDPIVSDYSDKEIAQAFNYLSRIAPNAMQNPILLKHYLRKYLASGGMLESFDLDQLMQLNQKGISNIKSTISELVR